ncbi:MAG: hypothetical protein ACKO3T_01180 [Planctomycetaceae bacterium]
MEDERLYEEGGVHPQKGDEIRASRLSRRLPGAVGVQEQRVPWNPL